MISNPPERSTEETKIMQDEDLQNFCLRRPSLFKSRLQGHSGPIFSLSIDCFDEFLISGSFDTTIRIWSLKSKNQLAVYNFHQAIIWSVKFANNSQTFASGSADCIGCVWSINSNIPI